MTDIVKRLRTIEMREVIRKDLCEAAAEIARLRSDGDRAAKAIDDFIDDLRMRAGMDKRNVDPDGTVAMPVGIGVLHRLREAQALLSSQPSEQPVSDDDDLPEVLANCENCRAIIRDGDVFVMDDYCVCLCSKCAVDQEGGE